MEAMRLKARKTIEREGKIRLNGGRKESRKRYRVTETKTERVRERERERERERDYISQYSQGVQ